jgi:acyl-CoA thioesterase-1
MSLILQTRAASPSRSERGVITFVVMLLALLLAAPLAAANTPPARTVLVVGDSLSAAYNLSKEQGWVHLMGEKLAKEHPGWTVVNASISGETTAGGAARIEADLKAHGPSIVIIELGANDGLRGLDLTQARANLTRMITASQATGAKVLLIGMHIPPNYGPDYTQAFHGMFAELAEAHDTALLPFLLEPIASDRDAFLPDNLHPTAEAQPRLLAHVWPQVEALVNSSSQGN